MNENKWWEGQGFDPEEIVDTLQAMYAEYDGPKREEIAGRWIYLQNQMWHNHMNGL